MRAWATQVVLSSLGTGTTYSRIHVQVLVPHTRTHNVLYCNDARGGGWRSSGPC